MSGGAGDDTYVVDNVGDMVDRKLPAKAPTRFSASVSYALAQRREP